MLHFLQPVWLFAMAGILFPIIIHLWNIKEGKTLKIGSISLLTKNARQPARSFRLKDILLLVIRCLIIISLALLLAKPVWQKQLHAKNTKGWILLDKQNLAESYKGFKPFIDSLLTAGFEFHYFNAGFQKIKLEEALKKNTDATEEDISYWTLLKQLDEQVPADLPLYVFTHNQLSRFKGKRPEVALDVHWSTYTSGDSLSPYMVNARLSSTDSIRAVVAHSSTAALRYHTEVISLQNPGPAIHLQHQGGKLFISAISDTALPVEVDTAVIKIIIYTDLFFADADYLKAAIDAVQQFGKFNIHVASTTSVNNIPPNLDWLFWLSQKDIPASFLKQHVFVYEKEKTVFSWMKTGDHFSSGDEAINIYKLVETHNAGTKGEMIWSNGFGEPILTLEKNESSVYHFYSRFNPAWNDLVWSPKFPQIIFDLLVKKGLHSNRNDQRTIDIHQLQPTIIQPKNRYYKRNFVETTDLTKALWVLTFVLFCLERYLSLNPKTEAYAGNKR